MPNTLSSDTLYIYMSDHIFTLHNNTNNNRNSNNFRSEFRMLFRTYDRTFFFILYWYNKQAIYSLNEFLDSIMGYKFKTVSCLYKGNIV